METLVDKMLAYIGELNKVRSILTSGQNMKLGVGRAEINIDSQSNLFSIPMTVLQGQIYVSLTQYVTWIENKIKDTAQEIIDI